MTALVPALTDPEPCVLVVNETVMQRINLTKMLERGGFRVVPVSSAEEAIQVLSVTPDVEALVVDVQLASAGMNCVEFARKVRADWNVDTIAVLGAAPVDRGLLTGIRFLAKPVRETTLFQLVRSMLAERRERPFRVADANADPKMPQNANQEQSQPLSTRQHEVLALLVEGKSNREIAQVMGLSENTVKVHLTAIYRALGVSSRTEAMLVELRRRGASKSQCEPPHR